MLSNYASSMAVVEGVGWLWKVCKITSHAHGKHPTVLWSVIEVGHSELGTWNWRGDCRRLQNARMHLVVLVVAAADDSTAARSVSRWCTECNMKGHERIQQHSTGPDQPLLYQSSVTRTPGINSEKLSNCISPYIKIRLSPLNIGRWHQNVATFYMLSQKRAYHCINIY